LAAGVSILGTKNAKKAAAAAAVAEGKGTQRDKNLWERKRRKKKESFQKHFSTFFCNGQFEISICFFLLLLLLIPHCLEDQ